MRFFVLQLSGSEVLVVHQDAEPTYYPESDQYVSRLRLERVSDPQFGTYLCIATNKVDSGSARVHLSRSISALAAYSLLYWTASYSLDTR